MWLTTFPYAFMNGWTAQSRHPGQPPSPVPTVHMLHAWRPHGKSTWTLRKNMYGSCTFKPGSVSSTSSRASANWHRRKVYTKPPRWIGQQRGPPRPTHSCLEFAVASSKRAAMCYQWHAALRRRMRGDLAEGGALSTGRAFSASKRANCYTLHRISLA